MGVSETLWIIFAVVFLSAAFLDESTAQDSPQEFICFLKSDEETFGSNPIFLFSKDEIFVQKTKELVKFRSPNKKIADIDMVGDIVDVYSGASEAIILRGKNGVYLAPNLELKASDESGRFKRAEYTKFGVLLIYLLSAKFSQY